MLYILVPAHDKRVGNFRNIFIRIIGDAYPVNDICSRYKLGVGNFRNIFIRIIEDAYPF
jgi:hypothetical protein